MGCLLQGLSLLLPDFAPLISHRFPSPALPSGGAGPGPGCSDPSPLCPAGSRLLAVCGAAPLVSRSQAWLRGDPGVQGRREAFVSGKPGSGQVAQHTVHRPGCLTPAGPCEGKGCLVSGGSQGPGAVHGVSRAALRVRGRHRELPGGGARSSSGQRPGDLAHW